jgi:DDE family transposase
VPVLDADDPVISVDTKKKEQVGLFAQAGREWAPPGTPVKVLDHDFLLPSGRHRDPVRHLRRRTQHRLRGGGHRPRHRRDRAGRVFAAINVSMHTSRRSADEARAETLPPLRVAARNIENEPQVAARYVRVPLA